MMKSAVTLPAIAALAVLLYASAAAAQQSICETVQRPTYDANGRFAGLQDKLACPGIIRPDVCDSGAASPNYDSYGRWQGYSCN
jgi:hypothetical protein